MEGVDVMKGMDSYWAGKHVFVTGANGFLGSWMVKDLVDQAATVTCLILDVWPRSQLMLSGTAARVTQVRGDLGDYASLVRILNEYEIDTCLHLAAQAIVPTAARHPLSTFESNIRGTWNLLEAVRVTGEVRRVVVASSDKVYGDSPSLPYREEDPLQSLHPYDVSKICADLLAQSYARSYGLPIAIARCGNFYGPGDLNWSRIVPGTCRSLIQGERPVIRSDGTYLRDYLFIGDASAAYLCLAAALDRKEIHGQAFNFGTERPTRVLDLVAELLTLAGRPDLEPEILNIATDEIKAQYLCTDKAKRLLGWQSQVSLNEGLALTYAWYERFLKDKWQR